MARNWFSDWGGKLTVACATVVVFHLLYVAFHWGGEENKSLISNIIAVIIYVGPCVLAWRVSRNHDLPRRVRRAWLFVSLAELSYLTGETMWLYFENILGVQPFPSLADVAYLAFYPLMMAGLLCLVERLRNKEERLGFILDACIILIGGGFATWFLLLIPITAAFDGDYLKTGLSIAYPIGDLVLLFGISSLILRRRGLLNNGPTNLILFAVILQFGADFIFGYQNIAGAYETGNLVDAMFTIASFPIMLGAHYQHLLSKVDAPRDQSNPPTRLRAAALFPYAAVIVTYWLLFKLEFQYREYLPGGDIVISAAVTALVLIRQFMFVRENVKTRVALTKLQERIQGIFAASTDAIGIASLDGIITEVNESFLRLTGFDHEEIVGLMGYQNFVPDNYLELSVTPDIAVETGRTIEYECELIQKSGNKRSVTATLFAINGSDGKPAAMAIVIRDITERKILEEQLTHQALHDPLTKLANRALFQDRVEHALALAKRTESAVSVLFLDLDNFKTVNDTLGHAAGDELLISVAGRLQSCLRASDTASRLGGDEFAVLIEDTAVTEEGITVAERLHEVLRSPFIVEGKQVFAGASIGIATSLAGRESPDELLRNADVAMYMAKSKGKNQYAIFEDAMHDDVLRRAQLESELRAALRNREFELVYQPIMDLESGRLSAIEALVRWNHPRKIDIGPDDFIPIAEEASLMPQLGQWILNEACSQAAVWHQEFTTVALPDITVNISSRQFFGQGLVEAVKSALDSSGLDAKSLILEITEGTMLKHTDETVVTLEQIRELGVRLAIDDFGTGYSALSYLHKFPIDLLKIDRSFIENINDGREGAAMARAIISMSKSLHLDTIAEGIETSEQIDALRIMGCEMGQGFLFARPLDRHQMQRFLNENALDFDPGENYLAAVNSQHVSKELSGPL